MKDVEVWKQLSLGSDHRAVKLTLKMARKHDLEKKRGATRNAKKQNNVGWEPENEQEYKEKVTKAVEGESWQKT